MTHKSLYYFGLALLLTGVSLVIVGEAFLSRLFPIVGCAPEPGGLCVGIVNHWFAFLGLATASVGALFCFVAKSKNKKEVASAPLVIMASHLTPQ